MTLSELGQCAKKALPGEYGSITDLGAGKRINIEYGWFGILLYDDNEKSLQIARILLEDLDDTEARKRKLLIEVITFLAGSSGFLVADGGE